MLIIEKKFEKEVEEFLLLKNVYQKEKNKKIKSLVKMYCLQIFFLLHTLIINILF